MTIPMQDFLTRYLQFHSVSLAEENEIPETAEFLRTQFTKLGATTSRILHTDRTNPAVYAVFPAQTAVVRLAHLPLAAVNRSKVRHLAQPRQQLLHLARIRNFLDH